MCARERGGPGLGVFLERRERARVFMCRRAGGGRACRGRAGGAGRRRRCSGCARAWSSDEPWSPLCSLLAYGVVREEQGAEPRGSSAGADAWGLSLPGTVWSSPVERRDALFFAQNAVGRVETKSLEELLRACKLCLPAVEWQEGAFVLSEATQRVTLVHFRTCHDLRGVGGASDGV